MLCIAFVCLLFLVSSPASPIDPKTVVDLVIEYFTVEGLSLSAELPGKQKPLDHSYIAHSFSLMLALDFAIVVRSYLF